MHERRDQHADDYNDDTDWACQEAYGLAQKVEALDGVQNGLADLDGLERDKGRDDGGHQRLQQAHRVQPGDHVHGGVDYAQHEVGHTFQQGGDDWSDLVGPFDALTPEVPEQRIAALHVRHEVVDQQQDRAHDQRDQEHLGVYGRDDGQDNRADGLHRGRELVYPAHDHLHRLDDGGDDLNDVAKRLCQRRGDFLDMIAEPLTDAGDHVAHFRQRALRDGLHLVDQPLQRIVGRQLQLEESVLDGADHGQPLGALRKSKLLADGLQILEGLRQRLALLDLLGGLSHDGQRGVVGAGLLGGLAQLLRGGGQLLAELDGIGDGLLDAAANQHGHGGDGKLLDGPGSLLNLIVEILDIGGALLGPFHLGAVVGLLHALGGLLRAFGYFLLGSAELLTCTSGRTTGTGHVFSGGRALVQRLGCFARRFSHAIGCRGRFLRCNGVSRRCIGSGLLGIGQIFRGCSGLSSALRGICHVLGRLDLTLGQPGGGVGGLVHGTGRVVEAVGALGDAGDYGLDLFASGDEHFAEPADNFIYRFKRGFCFAGARFIDFKSYADKVVFQRIRHWYHLP